jgi:hypothetical protein
MADAVRQADQRPAGGRRRPWRSALVLLPLTVFLAANSALWLQENRLRFPPPWDQANYLTMSLRYWHGLQADGLPGLGRALASASPIWPPLVPLSTLPLYALLGESRLVAHLTGGLYLFLLLLGIRSLAEAAYGPRAGLLAAVLACGFGDVTRLSRDYLLDFPSAALLTLGMAALVRSNELRRRSGALAFGVAVGLTALAKMVAGGFFVGPLLRVLLRRWRAGEAGPSLRGLALAGGAALAVAAPWWLPHLGTAAGFLVHFGLGEGATPYASAGSVLSFENLTYYGLVLINRSISFPPAVVFVALLLGRLAARWRGGAARVTGSPVDALLWTWIAAGYAILTLVPNKGGNRYGMYLLPAIAVLYAGLLGGVRRPVLRRALAGLALAAGAFNYAAQTWGVAGLPREVVIGRIVALEQEDPHLAWLRAEVPLSEDKPWPVAELPAATVKAVARSRVERGRKAFRAALAASATPSPEVVVRLGYRLLLEREPERDVHLEALRTGRLTAETLFEAIAGSDELRGRSVRALVAPDHPAINAATLNYYAEHARLPVGFAHLLSWPAPDESLAAYDAVIVKEGGWQGPDFTTRGTPALEAALRAPSSGYRPATSWACPDGSRVALFVRD